MNSIQTKITHFIGSSEIFVLKANSNTKISSGSPLGLVIFLCGVQFAVAAALWASFLLTEDQSQEVLVFCILFVTLGCGIAFAAHMTRGEDFYFEKRWLKISSNEIQFIGGVTWNTSDLKRVRLSTEWVPNDDQGESVGWEIEFENLDGTRQRFQFTRKNSMKRFWNSLTATGLPIEPE